MSDFPHTKKSAPRVSIGMPVYNGAKYIRGAVNSLLSQTFPDFELVISDNCTTDGTRAICLDYVKRDRRIRYIRQSENIGALANFESVFQEAAQAAYFMWAAHDDAWDSHFLERCVAALDRDHSRVFAFGRWISASRRVPFLRLAGPSHLEFLEDSAWRGRVVGYLRLPNTYQKANMVYALWRRGFLEHTRLKHMCILAGTEINVGQDMALCAAGLLTGTGYMDSDILFHKKYKNSPPGHWFCRIEATALGIVNKKNAWSRDQRVLEASSTEQYWKLIRSVLRRGGVSWIEADEILNEVVDRSWANER